MNIQLNGDSHNLPDGSSITDLVESLALQGKRIAVEVNFEIVPKSEHASVILKESDRVEIVHAIGGG